MTHRRSHAPARRTRRAPHPTSFPGRTARDPVVAACSGGGDGGGDGDGDGTAGTTSPAATTTTVPPLAGSRSPGWSTPATPRCSPARRSSSRSTTSTPARRPGPQAGINAADVVFEERTEGGITRFAAVFHSTDADPVVPVRSARFTDIEICSMLNRPLFANSGGNEAVMEAVRNANVVPVGNTDYGEPYYYRLPDRPRPHNLATSTPVLRELTPEGALPPPALFTYRAPGTSIPGASTAGGVHVEYGGGTAQSPVEHHYDAALGGWARFQNGTPHVDIAGVQVAPPNLVVQFIEYENNSGILDRRRRGLGVHRRPTRRRHVVRGSIRSCPPCSSTPTGAPIALLPGHTWVLLPPPGGGHRVL